MFVGLLGRPEKVSHINVHRYMNSDSARLQAMNFPDTAKLQMLPPPAAAALRKLRKVRCTSRSRAHSAQYEAPPQAGIQRRTKDPGYAEGEGRWVLRDAAEVAGENRKLGEGIAGSVQEERFQRADAD